MSRPRPAFVSFRFPSAAAAAVLWVSACQSSYRAPEDAAAGSELVDAFVPGEVGQEPSDGRTWSGDGAAELEVRMSRGDVQEAAPEARDAADGGVGGEDLDPDATVVDAAPGEAVVVDAAAGEQDAGAADAASGGDADPPLALSPCPDENAALCPDSDPLCLFDTGPGGASGGGGLPGGSFLTTWSVCTRFCETDADCPSEYSQARCVDHGRDRICVLDCSFGRACPAEGLSCSPAEQCAHFVCNCSGTGCQDSLCVAP